jgi:hypothetical protein
MRWCIAKQTAATDVLMDCCVHVPDVVFVFRNLTSPVEFFLDCLFGFSFAFSLSIASHPNHKSNQINTGWRRLSDAREDRGWCCQSVRGDRRLPQGLGRLGHCVDERHPSRSHSHGLRPCYGSGMCVLFHSQLRLYVCMYVCTYCARCVGSVCYQHPLD